MKMATTYSSIDNAIKALIKIEKAEEGYLEKASNKNLDSKTANAGDNNYTKYWRDLAELGLMGSNKKFAGGPSWYWCAGLQSWAFIKAFGQANAKKLLLHLPYTSCANLGTLAKKAKRLYSDPKVGDVVLFYNGSRFYHTGLVINVTSTQIKTVEGNTNQSKEVVPNGGAVCIKTYTRSTCKKKGHMFFRPDYSIVVKKTSTTTKKAETKPSSSTQKKKNTKKTTTPAKKYATINTTGSNLRCRKAANDTSTIIGKFDKGSKVEILEKTNGTWWKVKGKDTSANKTITGYSACKYLKEIK